MKSLNTYTNIFVCLFVALPFISCGQNGQKKKPVKAATTKSNSPGSSPVIGRYQCYRLGFVSNEVAPDLKILSADTYESMGKTGKFSYDPATKIIKWLNGPLHQPSKNWVGVFSPKGTPTDKGGKTVSTLIEIRSMSDIKEGNLRVLQSCACDK